MLRKSTMSLLVLTALTSTCWAQVKLERKIPDGSSFTTDVRVTMDQTLTIVGMEIETNSETHMVSKSRAGNRANDGTLRVQEKIESLQVNIGGAAGDYSFDSANADAAGNSPLEVIRGVHKSIAERTTTMVYGKDNLVEDVEFDEGILPSLSTQVQAQVKGQLDPDAIKTVSNQTLKALPDDTVSKGDSWERTELLNLGAGQEMTFEVEYTYNGTVQQGGKELDKISLKVKTVEFTMEASDAIPLTLKDSYLEIGSSEGTILFDRAAGRIVSSRQKTQIKGKINFEANGQELPSTLDLKLNSETNEKAG